ncbi:hypothetical protein Bbelb_106110 [Branchiostoma belcheri]|nr:hypothetical protein Bbelb_106110 [Branchiostoma belcheri]
MLSLELSRRGLTSKVCPHLERVTAKLVPITGGCFERSGELEVLNEGQARTYPVETKSEKAFELALPEGKSGVRQSSGAPQCESGPAVGTPGLSLFCSDRYGGKRRELLASVRMRLRSCNVRS